MGGWGPNPILKEAGESTSNAWNGGGFGVGDFSAVVILLIKFGKERKTISDFGSEQIWERSGEVWTSARHV